MCGLVIDRKSIQIRDSADNVIDIAREDTLQEVKLILQDVAKETTLQEVAKEETLQGIKSNLDKFQFDENNLLKVVLQGDGVGLKPVDNHFSTSLSVTTTTVQVSTDTMVRDEITIICDVSNTAKVYLGNSNSNTPIPLSAGDTITIKKCSLSKVWLKSESGTQIVYVDAGGGW